MSCNSRFPLWENTLFHAVKATESRKFSTKEGGGEKQIDWRLTFLSQISLVQSVSIFSLSRYFTFLKQRSRALTATATQVFMWKCSCLLPGRLVASDGEENRVSVGTQTGSNRVLRPWGFCPTEYLKLDNKLLRVVLKPLNISRVTAIKTRGVRGFQTATKQTVKNSGDGIYFIYSEGQR